MTLCKARDVLLLMTFMTELDEEDVEEGTENVTAQGRWT